MTTRTISGYSSGFAFSPDYSGLSITATGTVGGTGVTSGDLAAYTIVNAGTIAAVGAGSLGVDLGAGGSITNGSASDLPAMISGRSVGVRIAGVAGTIVNFGTIEGGRTAGIELEAGGSVTNGPGAAALIEGYVGIEAAGQAAITNYGTIDGTGGTAVEFASAAGSLTIAPGASFVGKVLGDGGALSLAAGGAGTLTGLGTSFSGFGHVDVAGGADWILNGSNTIVAGAAMTNGGRLQVDGYLSDLGGIAGGLELDGGTLSIGASGALTNVGVAVDGAVAAKGSVTNLGTVSASGSGSVGVDLNGGGKVVNGASGDQASLIEGSVGVVIAGAGAVVNYGDIVGFHGTAVHLESRDADLVVEGGARFGGAVIAHGGVLELAGAGGAGSLSGLGDSAFSGFSTVDIDGGATWTLNGAATAGTLINAGSLTVTDGLSIEDALFNQAGATLKVVGASIAGGVGVTLTNHGVIVDDVVGYAPIALGQGGALINYGSIGATGASPILFGPSDGLVVEAGSSIGGVADLGGGLLALGAGGGAGSLSGLGGAAPYTNFGTLSVQDKAVWTLTGANTVALGVTLSNAGTLINSGTLVIDGAMAPAGGSLINEAGSLITGQIVLGGTGTLTDQGAIDGGGGTAILFHSAKDVLVLDPGSVIDGAGDLGGGALELQGDGGTLTGLGAATGLSDFGALAVLGGPWTLVGDNTIAPGVDVHPDSLILGGTVRNEGRLATERSSGVDLTGTLVNQGNVIGGYSRSYVKFFWFNQHITLSVGGVAIDGGSAITNSGLIESVGGFGAIAIEMAQGGDVTNGSAAHPKGEIDATSYGVDIGGGAGTVTNFGVIETGADSYPIRFDRAGGAAVTLDAGGTIVNGGTGAGDNGALIFAGDGATFGVRVAGAAGVVENFGGIDATYGPNFDRTTVISLADGGSVTNGADDDVTAGINGGAEGIDIAGAPGTVVNFGVIQSWTGRSAYTYNSGEFQYSTVVAVGGPGIKLEAGGLIVNGDPTDDAALIDSRYGVIVKAAAGTIRNFGTIESTSTSYFGSITAISLFDGGSVTNGADTDTAAVIDGRTNGVLILGAVGTVQNFGTIETWTGSGTYVYYGRYKTQTYVASGASAVDLGDGGLVVNGSQSDTKALLESRYGVQVTGAVGTIWNFGSIIGGSVGLGDSGSIINGAPGDTTALINGTGFELIDGNAGTVTNYGTIVSFGISLETAARVVNGSASDTAALISGHLNGVYATSGVVRNDGAVIATASPSAGANRPAAIHLESGGTIVNGDSSALIQGYLGVDVSAGAATVTNFGAIVGAGAKSGIGVLLHDDGVIVNGGATYRKASISGFTGVSVGADATITNFGTIAGTGGTALAFHGTGGVLIVEGGASFSGKVVGDDATLELDRQGGAGTIAGIGVAAGGGGFTGFTDIRVASGADWTVAGSNAIAADGTLVNDGTLIATGTLAGAGAGAVAGAGVLDIAAGARLDAAGAVGAGQTIGFAGDGALAIGDAGAFGAGLSGFGQGDSIDLTSFAFSAAEKLHFAENAAKTAGTLVVTDGAMRLALTLFGQFTAAGFSVKTDGHSGSIITYTPTATATAFQLAAPHH